MWKSFYSRIELLMMWNGKRVDCGCENLKKNEHYEEFVARVRTDFYFTFFVGIWLLKLNLCLWK